MYSIGGAGCWFRPLVLGCDTRLAAGLCRRATTRTADPAPPARPSQPSRTHETGRAHRRLEGGGGWRCDRRDQQSMTGEAVGEPRRDCILVASHRDLPHDRRGRRVERKDLLGASLEEHTAEFSSRNLTNLVSRIVIAPRARRRILSVTRARAGSQKHHPIRKGVIRPRLLNVAARQQAEYL